MCITVLEGTERLSSMASDFHRINGLNARHVYTNLRITPAPDGARGFVYFNQLDVSTLPPHHDRHRHLRGHAGEDG